MQILNFSNLMFVLKCNLVSVGLFGILFLFCIQTQMKLANLTGSKYIIWLKILKISNLKAMQNLQVQTWEHRVLWLLKTVLEGVLGELALIKINKKGSDKFPNGCYSPEQGTLLKEAPCPVGGTWQQFHSFLSVSWVRPGRCVSSPSDRDPHPSAERCARLRMDQCWV